MTPLQIQLLDNLDLPLWQCTHPERLPYAPEPAAAPAELVVVVGDGVPLPRQLVNDIARALTIDDGLWQLLSESEWKKAGCPQAPVMLGLNLAAEPEYLTCSGTLPLTVEYKRRLWSCLCSLTIAR